MFDETASVVQWYTFGLYLSVRPCELEIINLECRFNREGLARMLSAWLKTGEATWLSLVCALRKMGQSDLASKIARKKGMCVYVCVCVSSHSPVYRYELTVCNISKMTIPAIDLITKEFLWMSWKPSQMDHMKW